MVTGIPVSGMQFHGSQSPNGTASSNTNHAPAYIMKEGDQSRIFTVSQVPHPPFEKLANPGPLGLLSFAITTFVLGLYQCGAG